MSRFREVYEVQFSKKLLVEQGNLLSDFQFPWKDEVAPVTRFRAVWNDECLAFQFRVVDDDLVLPPHEDPGEGALESDRVELFFSPTPDLLPFYYGAEMDPQGRVHDYRASYHRQFEPEWGFQSLRFRGDLTEEGYEVQGTFDLAELRDLGCLRDREIIAGVYRAEFSHGSGGIDRNWISWVQPDSPTPDFHIPSSFGRFFLVGK